MAGSRILITGGASGLGRAMAARFAGEGWRVLITDVDAEALAKTQVELEPLGPVRTHALDVRDDAQWDAVRQWCEREWQGLDVLVNNAGVAAGGLMERIPMADWEWILDINVKGVVRGCRTFLPMFKAQGAGHIVNVASLAAISNLPGMASYNVSKSAVVSLSQTLSYEVAPYGVTTSVVCPAFVKTNLGSTMRSPDPAALVAAERMMAASSVTPEDVARRVADAVRDKRFLVLTHREGHAVWWLRRLAPGLLERLVRRRWSSLRRRFDPVT